MEMDGESEIAGAAETARSDAGNADIGALSERVEGIAAARQE
jgi:hypothetical protein